jgi:hypothetical protein
MNSTPKQQEDESVAASGSLSPLEQTLMGVAPLPAAPASASAPAAPIEPASIILPSSPLAPSSPPPVEAAEALPAPSATLVATPTIAISRPPAEPAPSVNAAVVPAVAPEAAGNAPLGATLRIEPSTPAVLAPPRPAPRERVATERAAPSERTALSADYLVDARSAALNEVEQLPTSPHPLALASTERTPLAEVAAAVASTLTSAGDTHRSVAPPLEPAAAAGQIASGSVPSGTRGFEPVPVVRAPLAECLSSTLGPLAELGGTRNPLPPSSRPRPAAPRGEREGGAGAGRWLLLVAVALISVGVVSVGGRLWHRYGAQSARQRVVASVEASASSPAMPSNGDAPSASHALLANRPASEPGAVERVRVISATAEVLAGGAGSSASPESQLAATAGRHVLSGNYAEALPLYRQLERGWPEHTAYAAMARLLEKKVGSQNDTRTVAPTP